MIIELKNKIINRYKKMTKPVKASIWFLICSFMQKGISVITTPIFTRLLTTNEYGMFSVFNSWLSIVSILICLNLFSGVYTQGLVKFENDRPKFVSSLQGLNFVLCLLWSLIYLIFHDFFNQILSLTTVQVLAMLVMIWSTAVFNLWAGEQRVSYSYIRLVIVTLIVSIAKPGLGILFVVYANDKVTARILGLALVELICYAWMFVIQINEGKQFVNIHYWKYVLSFNLPLVPHYLSQIVLNNSDRLMINKIVGPNEAGIYSLAYSLAQIMILFNVALLQTIEPWIFQKIKANKTEDIARVAYPTMIAIAILNLLLIAFAPEIVRVFAPSTYYDAIWVIPPVSMSVFFMFSYCFFANFEFYYEKRKFIMLASIGAALLNLILNYIFIRKYGYCAAGYTTLVCYIVYALGHYLFMQQICKENLNGKKVYDWRILITITICFIVMGFTFMFTYDHMFIRYCIIGLIMIICLTKHKNICLFVNKFIDLRKQRNNE